MFQMTPNEKFTFGDTGDANAGFIPGKMVEKIERVSATGSRVGILILFRLRYPMVYQRSPAGNVPAYRIHDGGCRLPGHCVRPAVEGIISRSN
jgi:hypothetical protein